MTTKICLNKSCGKEIEQTPKAKPKLYCSDACRLTAHRKKMKSIPIAEWDLLQDELKTLRAMRLPYKKVKPAAEVVSSIVSMKFPGRLPGESSIDYRIRLLENNPHA